VPASTSQEPKPNNTASSPSTQASDQKKPDQVATNDKTAQPTKRAKPNVRDRILKSELVNKVESERGPDGAYFSLAVYQTDEFNFPILLQEERVLSADGEEVVTWSAMAADQVILRLESDSALANIQDLLDQTESVLEPTDTPNLYTVHFDGSDPATVGYLSQELSKTSGVKYAEPNRIISIN